MNGFELILPFLRPIQHLILDPDISEIMVNGPERIFIEKAGYLQAVPGVKLTPESLIVAVKNIARRLGDDISEENPILDSRLPDGSRVAAVIPPCSIHGVALTIRKFNSHKFKMKDLIEGGTITAELAEQLEEYVLQRKNLLVCGGTGSGKTTLANILTEFIPDFERVVLIEDTAEMQIQKENVLRFESRNIVIQVERRPGRRFVSQVLEIRGYDPEADRYDLDFVYMQQEKPCKTIENAV